MRQIIIFLLLINYVFSISAQELRNPFNFPILLSGNFGELRNNHFHSGIDFKTQGVEGKPMHAVQDGYISRISVSPWGYGLALYMDHPDGTTTVYGHIQQFNDSISAYVKSKQYEEESYTVNLYPEKDRFTYQKGEVIALSGNSGSSGGPHLHFEIRNTETGEVVDPLPYYMDQIRDTRPPRIQGIMIYPIEGKGIVNDDNKKVEIIPVQDKNGNYTINKKIEAWGEIGIGIKAYDYMNETGNVYGVKKITLNVDSQTVYHSDLTNFLLSETRYLNSFTDYEEWKDKRSFYMKSFVEPGNKLRFIKSTNRGYIPVREERKYVLTYTLEDVFGNQATIDIPIEGKEQLIPAPETMDSQYFHWKSDNRFGAKGIRLYIPKNNLYDDIYFHYDVKNDSTALAATHKLHNRTIPIHESAQLSIRLQTDTLTNKKQYGIVRIQNGKPSWIGGEYRNGWMDADIRDLGTFTIRQDTKGPTITPVNKDKWMSTRTISFRLSDNLSGLKTYRGEIDGEYALFEFDGKKGLISYSFDTKRLSRGKHELVMTAVDACGNISEYRDSFVW